MAYFQRTDGSGVLVLAPGDNIAVATTALPAGTGREVAGVRIVLATRVDVGHKFALRPIAKGDRIVKYGAPIGVALRAIAPGEYVHTHNMVSDYIPTYTLEEGHRFVEEAE
jgi:predicted RecA/RadA family phage recombinase